MPGRKTDVRDCEWLCDLLRHGLLKASFIPPLEIRELRELTRCRQTLVKEQATLANRIARLLEGGSIKLGQVATDIMGVSGRLMLKQLANGEQSGEKLASLARGSLRKKELQLRRALTGNLTTAQRFVLAELLKRVEELDAALLRAGEEIRREIETAENHFLGEAIELLQTIPGIGERVAQVIVSEIGVDMTRFPDARHLSSWAGMCPGNHESAGKRKSGRTTKGKRQLRTALVQAAWAATHQKNTCLSSLYRRLVKSKGKQRALVAVGHSMLVIIYHVLARQASYQELGGDYFEKQNIERQRTLFVRRLEMLGVKVTIEELPLAE